MNQDLACQPIRIKPVLNLLPPGAKYAAHIPWAYYPSGCQRGPSWFACQPIAGKVFSRCTRVHRGLCCNTHRAQQVRSEASHLRCSMCRWAVFQWSNGITPGSKPGTGRSRPSCGGTGAGGRGHLPCRPASGAPRPPSDWCCHRRTGGLRQGRTWWRRRGVED